MFKEKFIVSENEIITYKGDDSISSNSSLQFVICVNFNSAQLFFCLHFNLDGAFSLISIVSIREFDLNPLTFFASKYLFTLGGISSAEKHYLYFLTK